MEEERLTEEQVIERVGSQGVTVTLWQLERWHKADVIPRPQVEFLGYGKGTRSTYPASVIPQVLAVCRLLEQKNKDTNKNTLNRVKFQLWREGYPIALQALKETVYTFVPPLDWPIPRRRGQKYDAAEKRATAIQQAMRRVGDNILRFLLRRFKRKTEQGSFVTIHMYLFYGIRYDFSQDEAVQAPSPAEILSQGLELNALRFLPKDLTADFQQLSHRRLLSLSNMKNALNEATEEDFLLARSRMEMMGPLFECFEIMGYIPSSWHLSDLYSVALRAQALFLVFLIHLEKEGFGTNIETLFQSVRTHLPVLQIGHAVHLALLQELPALAHELLAFEDIGRLATEAEAGNVEAQEQFAGYLDCLRAVYVRHQTDLDAFWHRHPEWVIA